jgi:hypothetical protein
MPYRFDIFSFLCRSSCLHGNPSAYLYKGPVCTKKANSLGPGKGEESMKEEPPVKIQTDKSRKYFGVVRQNFSRDKKRGGS